MTGAVHDHCKVPSSCCALPGSAVGFALTYCVSSDGGLKPMARLVSCDTMYRKLSDTMISN